MDCKTKNLLNEDDCDKLEQRFEDLEKRWKKLQPVHDDNRKRFVVTLCTCAIYTSEYHLSHIPQALGFHYYLDLAKIAKPTTAASLSGVKP